MSMSGADTYRLDESRRAHTHAMRRITNPALKRAGYRWRVAGVERDETGEVMETYWRLHRPDGSPVLAAEQQAEIDRVVDSILGVEA